MDKPIWASDLSLAFGEVQAIRGISLEVAKGELFGLIGPDGAGKTTLIRILISLLLPDTGRGRVLGLDIVKDYRAIRREVGYVPGHSALYHDLSVWENLRFYATVFGTRIEDNYHLIKDIFEPLQPFRHRPAGKLSGGMRQKLALSCALIHRPQLIFLDEPSTGVDPVSRLEFWDTVAEIVEQGITVVVATPYMDEAERCHRMALMMEGSVLSIDSPQGLIKGYQPQLLAISGGSRRILLESLRTYPGLRAAYARGEAVHASFDRAPDAEELDAWLSKKGMTKASISRISPDIEDVFIEST